MRFALDPCRPAASRALSYLSLASVGEYGTIDALLGCPRLFQKGAYRPCCASEATFGRMPQHLSSFAKRLTDRTLMLRIWKLIHIRNEKPARLGKCPAWTRHFRTS
jgi:hypothetical protein